MSFGYSAGDFILCIQLAHKVWAECRDAPQGFRAISGKVASLQLVLKEIREAIDTNEPSQDKKDSLKTLLEGCNDVLQKLPALLTKYKSLGTQRKRT